MLRFKNVSCSQCGKDFGSGDHGYSYCVDHRSNACSKCKNWVALQPDDSTAPEGVCGLNADPGFFPFGYWPNTLRSDGCGDGFQPRKAITR